MSFLILVTLIFLTVATASYLLNIKEKSEASNEN